MNLFRRLILSLFPQEITNNSINPANMFVSFISTKDFFSIINRKVVENYKTNLFDISLESLEAQIGRDPEIKNNKNEINNYYAYCSVANINGYTFFNISNMSCCMTIASSLLIYDIFLKYEEKIFTNFLFTIYLLPYLFASKIKEFPYKDKKKNYNWLVELTFSFFIMLSPKKYHKDIKEIKQALFSHPYIFFILLEFLTKISDILFVNSDNKNVNNKIDGSILLSRINNGIKVKNNPLSPTVEVNQNSLFDTIFPNDILPKYLFNKMNSFSVVKTIIGSIYNKDTLLQYAKKIKEGKTEREKDENIKNFITYITDQNLFKKNFFNGGRKYISESFYKNSQEKKNKNIEAIFSEIGDINAGIPENIKEESKIMEKLLNFYITISAGFSSSKSDSFYLKFFHQPLLKDTITSLNKSNKEQNLQQKTDITFWKKYYKLYNTCTQYYQNIYEGIKQNKKTIIFKYHYNKPNLIPRGIISLFQENFFATLLQEINPKKTKLYIKNTAILLFFEKSFGEQIQEKLKMNNETFIHSVYENFFNILQNPTCIEQNLNIAFGKNDFFNLKENLYTLDFWLRRLLLKNIQIHNNIHNDNIILAISAISRETLLGILILLTNMRNQHYSHLENKILDLYIYEILCCESDLATSIKSGILTLLKEYDEILSLYIYLDDNKEYLQLILKYIASLENNTKINNIHYEQIIRFKGVLQTISSYNKRYLLPK